MNPVSSTQVSRIFQKQVYFLISHETKFYHLCHLFSEVLLRLLFLIYTNRYFLRNFLRKMAETKTTKKLPENCSRFRSFVYRLVESKVFGAAILFVILSNTVVLIVNTSEEISVKGGIRLFIVNFCIIFSKNAIYKHCLIYLWQKNYGNGKKWHSGDYLGKITNPVSFFEGLYQGLTNL